MRFLARSTSVLAVLAALSMVAAVSCTPDYKAPPGEKDSHQAKSGEARAKPAAAATRDDEAAADDKAPAADDGTVAKDEAKPSEPAKEPTTPKEIELARKTAMVEGRDEDVLKYCTMQGIDSGKGDEQAILGCTLSACRLKQTNKARDYAKGLKGALKKQAQTVCQANSVIL